ncbi:peptide ABC transporter substrate-binding protein [soil metagenome]
MKNQPNPDRESGNRQTVRWRRTLAVAAAFSLLITSFGGMAIAQDDPAPYYSDTMEVEQRGGTLRFLLYEDPNTLNAVAGATTIAYQVITAITEGLTENDPDGNYVPVLAAELPTVENGGVSEDLLTITWTLKEGVVWSDGEPFTSEDVRFTWEAASNPDSGSALASDYALIADVQTPDPLTAVVTYSEFNAGYLDQFPWILPAHATGEPADMLNWEFNRNPIGTGPFKLDEWSSGEYLQLSRNENYREEGQPVLDGLTFLVIPDETVRTQLMIEEGAELMLWAGQEAEEQIQAAGTGTSRTAPGIWVMQMRFNLSKPFDDDPGVEPPHPILGDIRVREAITLAVNRDRINDSLLTGTTTFDIDSPLSVGWMACEVEPFTHNPEAATALLDEAGWRDEDGDGVREAHSVPDVEDGTKLSLTMNGYTGFDVLDLIELAVQEDLANVGIEASIENQEFAVIFGTWADNSPRMLGDYDILIYDSGLFAEPGNDITNLYHPDNVPSAELPGGDNFQRWVREDVGGWIDAGNTSPELDVRRENYCNVADAIREDIITFPILQFAEGSVYSNKLHGYTVSTWEYATWDAENWWLEQ